MTKIDVSKVKKTHSHIVYHYKINKAKRDLNRITHRSISNKKINVIKNVKPVIEKKNLLKKKPKSKFVPHPKINNIKDIGNGKILVIFAPGPSILEVEISRIKQMENVSTMTVNKPDDRFWPTDYWLFCDRSQYLRNKTKFHHYKGMVINTTSINQAHNNQIKIKNLQGKNFSTNLNKGFYVGRSSTYAAMQAALWMNFEKIFIFGLDMCKVNINGKDILHSYGVNPDVNENIRVKRFSKEAVFYDNAVLVLKEDAKRFYMCSSYNPWSFVDKYNRVDHKEAINMLSKFNEELSNV